MSYPREKRSIYPQRSPTPDEQFYLLQSPAVTSIITSHPHVILSAYLSPNTGFA